MRRLLLCIIWLTIAAAEMQSKVDVTSSITSDATAKVKRYLNHGIGGAHDSVSPCPPYYPHYHQPQSPMYLSKPYTPPLYHSKPSVYVSPIMSQHHHAQYIHQPPYSSYVPKQTISYVKPHISKPLYNYLPAKPIIHQVQPIQHNTQWQYPQVNYHQKPQYAYAPAYYHPKPLIQHDYVKPVNYHVPQVSHSVIEKPGIVYKSEHIKCAPCHHQQPQYHSQPIRIEPSYVKPIAPLYLPSQSHVQSSIIKHVHGVPCGKK